MEGLIKEHEDLDRKVYDYSVVLLKPFYAKRRSFVASLPRFWPTVLDTCGRLSPYITYEDSLVFDTLREIWIEWDETNLRNVTIELDFGDNPYFEAQRLRKTLLLDSSGEYYYSTTETPIVWKGKSLLDAHTRGGGDESFFTWFSYTTTDKKEDRDENTEIAKVICDEIYPVALEIYQESQEDDDVEEEYDLSE